MKYFRAEEDPKGNLPKNFISGFLEVSIAIAALAATRSVQKLTCMTGKKLVPVTQYPITHPNHMPRSHCFRNKVHSSHAMPERLAMQLFEYLMLQFSESSYDEPSGFSALATSNFSSTTSQRSAKSFNPFSNTSCTWASSSVWMRRFIFGSEGCGIE